MQDVVVLGVGMTKFDLLPDRTIKQMAEEACWKAFNDAGIKPGSVEAAYCGYVLGRLNGQECVPGQLALREVGITEIPIIRIESACSSGSIAFQEAFYSVASGRYEVALALGLEKMTGGTKEETREAMVGGADNEIEGQMGITFPGVFAMMARLHMETYGTTLEQLSELSVKNRKHGSLNLLSQFQEEVTIDEVLDSRMVADPLHLLHCCPLSDGCAAVIVCSKEFAKKININRAVNVASTALISGTYKDDLDFTKFEPTQRASREAYEKAGIGPEDIDLAEVHDCFSIAEILHYEDLGFCNKGEGSHFIKEASLGGKKPVNVSGGLLAKGHPLGATGTAQVVEIVTQLRNEAGERQVENPKTGLCHCLGGFTHGDLSSTAISILKK